MAELQQDRSSGDGMWRWWPCFIAGACTMILSHGLVEWMPPAAAVGLSFFAMWVVVGLVFLFSPPDRTWNLGRWTASGASGALIAAVLAWFVHR